jgi:hypothetical protein
MGWGFRKSFKLAPGVRFNLSKRGGSVSAGPKGAKVSANTRRQKTVSLSRFGVFWRKRRSR